MPTKRAKPTATQSARRGDSRHRPTRPWAGVVVLVFQEDKFLLTLRAKPPRAGIWGLPGGALNLGETVFQAAIREVREETGILCAPYASFTTVDVIEPSDSPTPDYHFLLAAVAAEWREGDVTPASDATDARWFDFGELNNVPHFPSTIELVRQALLQRKL
ncbi:MAG: NUDIX hydrolase [Alphaproteobacteria bacterium]